MNIGSLNITLLGGRVSAILSALKASLAARLREGMFGRSLGIS